jgi:hypothetical protein
MGWAGMNAAAGEQRPRNNCKSPRSSHKIGEPHGSDDVTATRPAQAGSAEGYHADTPCALNRQTKKITNNLIWLTICQASCLKVFNFNTVAAAAS